MRSSSGTTAATRMPAARSSSAQRSRDVAARGEPGTDGLVARRLLHACSNVAQLERADDRPDAPRPPGATVVAVPRGVAPRVVDHLAHRARSSRRSRRACSRSPPGRRPAAARGAISRGARSRSNQPCERLAGQRRPSRRRPAGSPRPSGAARAVTLGQLAREHLPHALERLDGGEAPAQPSGKHARRPRSSSARVPAARSSTSLSAPMPSSSADAKSSGASAARRTAAPARVARALRVTRRHRAAARPRQRPRALR